MKKNILTLLFAFTLIASASWELDFDEDYASASTGTPDILDGLVAWWKMDEASWNGTAGEVKDSTSTNNGTAAGSATTADGKINRAGTFNGSSTYVTIGSTIFSSANITEITITCWINRSTGDSFEQIITKDTASGRDLALDWQKSFGPRFYIGGSANGVAACSGINITGWIFVCVTYKNGTVHIYLNGAEVGFEIIIPFASSIALSSSVFTVGAFGVAYGGDRYNFSGLIDDARIYNRAISSNEVSTIYNKFK